MIKADAYNSKRIRITVVHVDQVRKDLFVMAKWRCWQVVVYILLAHTGVMSQTEGPGTESNPKSDEILQAVSIDVQDTVDIAVFHSNDLNGQFFRHGESEVFRGGMASRIPLIREARRKGPVVLDAGDALGPSTLLAWDKGRPYGRPYFCRQISQTRWESSGAISFSIASRTAPEEPGIQKIIVS